MVPGERQQPSPPQCLQPTQWPCSVCRHARILGRLAPRQFFGSTSSSYSLWTPPAPEPCGLLARTSCMYYILTTTVFAVKLIIILLEVREKSGLSPEDLNRSPEEKSNVHRGVGFYLGIYRPVSSSRSSSGRAVVVRSGRWLLEHLVALG
jgi:hypothetical protein